MIVPDPDRWKRLSPLLDSLLDLEGAAREARLDEIAREDAEIGAELRDWLADEREAGAKHFLSGHAELPVEPEPITPHRLAGERIGAYILETPLGQGGSGVVWQARRGDGRFEGKVALKLLHLSLIGRSAALRFEREGAILARLAHPNIARLLDAGITAVGQPYLVLELVDGERIDRHCDASHLRIDQRIALFRDVLGAVTHAHRHLVVHRDIKPSNILVSADGTVKLLDFGIAKLLHGDTDGGSTEITRDGGRALTPDYAAPEQLRGEEVTTATDVYSLGVLLYQLLTGRHPTAQARTTPDALMRSTLDADPSRLSTAVTASDGASAEALARISIERDTSLIRLKRQLGGDLENIVAKALRKLPADRYATVDAFSDDLRRWGTGEPVRARADTLAYRTARFVARHRGKVAAGALTSVAIVAGVIGTISQARRAEQQAHEAQVERDNALRDLAYADAARDLLGFLVSQGNAQPQTASELLGHAEQLTEQQFADDLPTRGRLELLLGIEYGNVDEYEKSKQVLARAQASARAAGDAALLSNVDCLLAATLGDQNETERALAMFGDAIERLQAPSQRNGSVLAACLHMRADLHAHLGQSQAMLADAQAALAALGPPRADQRVLANSIRVVVAEAYGRLGQTAQALAAYEKSIADLASMGRQQSARTAVRYSNFSRMLYVAGQPRRAEEMAARGLEIMGSGGHGEELEAILEGNRAHALIELGRLDEARSLTEQALAAATARKDLRWAGTFALYGAPASCAGGDVARCAALLQIARDRFKATLPAAHANFAVIELEAAQLAQAQGQSAEVRAHLVRAVELFEAASDRSPLRIRALGMLAQSELAAGNVAAAARHAGTAVDDARAAAKGLASSEWLGGALVAQALVRQRQGDKAGAQAGLHEAVDQLAGAVGEDAPATREARALLAAS